MGEGDSKPSSAALRPGISCPCRVTGDAAGCVTAQATSGSCVVNPENPGFHEAGEEHWSDATLEGRAGEWKGAELEFPLKLGLHCKRSRPITLVGLRYEDRDSGPPNFPGLLPDGPGAAGK